MVIDPVCGMLVDETTAAERAVHNGVTYYFCSVKCRHDFVKQPDDFVRALNLIEPVPPRVEEPDSMALRCWHALGAGWRSLFGKIARRGPDH